MIVRGNLMVILLPIIVVLMVLFALAWRYQPARNPERKSPHDQALAQKQLRRK